MVSLSLRRCDRETTEGPDLVLLAMRTILQNQTEASGQASCLVRARVQDNQIKKDPQMI